MAWTQQNQFTKGDEQNWSLPPADEWMITTVAVHELLINPTDMDLLPGQIQNDIEQWTVIAAPAEGD